MVSELGSCVDVISSRTQKFLWAVMCDLLPSLVFLDSAVLLDRSGSDRHYSYAYERLVSARRGTPVLKDDWRVSVSPTLVESDLTEEVLG